ncbi:MAG: transcription antiterminator [Clostridium sp.]|uniref:BglG family transcription antiterminator n=1 Tax=Clostridium sp. TaxID=1506 RepID=UPI0025B83C65|nr:BglG family transcription antiterminator [Clostridium sp.]MCF0147960.1 transcription antiterminator [Clostridium sp.]
MNKELVLVINLLLEKKFITIKDLEEDTGLSTRQILYRLEKINSLLKERGVEAINLKQNKDMIIKSEIKNELREILNENNIDNQYYLSKEERLAFIYLILFINPEYLSLNHFIDAIKASRSSIIFNIKELEEILNESNVYIKNNRTVGYYLSGSEVEIRKFMIIFLNKILSTNREGKILTSLIEKYNLDSYEYSMDIILKLANKHNMTFVEDRLQDFIYIYIFLKARITSKGNEDFSIPKLSDISLMESMKEHDFVKDLLENQGALKDIKAFDLDYISAWIIGISVGDINNKTADMAIISKMVIKIMRRFENISGFSYINHEKVFEQLYSHIRPAYYRLLFKFPIDNPLCDRIKDEYKELYKLVKETMKPFNEIFEQEIPEDELGYLTIHFGAILFNEREIKAADKKIALITCSAGIGTSALLYAEIKNLFPELEVLEPIKISNLKDVKEQVDLIFTTAYCDDILKLQKPIIKVNPVMTVKEKNSVKREVGILLGNWYLKQPKVDEVISIIKKHCEIKSEALLKSELMAYFFKLENFESYSNTKMKLSEMISGNLILFKVKANNLEEAIRNSAKSLVENNIVAEEYVDAMVNHAIDSKSEIVITKNVALPHAKPEYGAKKTAMGIGVLENPVNFGSSANDPVKYVFSLSSLDHKKHLQAMAELLELLEDKEFYNILDNGTNPKEVIDYIKKFE